MSIEKIPVRKKIALELFRKYRQNESRLHVLNYILWECTLRCNLVVCIAAAIASRML
jgi:hypothetical protein